MYRPSSKLWVCLTAALGVVVSLLALYEHVLYRYGLAKGPSFCNISQHINCEAVNASEWSMFLGIPIASYGLFFYVSVLGMLWISGPQRAVADSRTNQVVFVGGVVGSILSIALFFVSEFLIGSLCLLCMALYLVNFLLLALSWWGSGTRFLVTFVGGVKELLGFAVGAVRLDRASVAGAVSLLLWAGVAAASPSFTYGVAKILHRDSGLKNNDPVAPDDPVRAWREAAVVSIPVELGAGAFGDYAKGEPRAAIQIVEFADFECPGCRMLYAALEPVLKKYEGHYQLIFKNYPLDSSCNPGITRKFHQNACFAAYFIRCAGEQEQFWAALDFAFTDPALEQQVDSGEPELRQLRDTFVSQGAAALGIDSQALRECIDSQRYLAHVRKEISQGDTLGLHSTPSFWINGRKVERPTPEVFEHIFDAILAEHGDVQGIATTDTVD